MVGFSFSCCGFFDVAEAGFRQAESAVELMEADFSGGSGLSRGEARRSVPVARPLTAPSRRKSHEHEIERGGRQALAVRRPRGFQRF